MLCLNNLGHTYDCKPLWRGISACLPLGSRVLLCGANGSGKSTLLHILAGLFTPSAGSFRLGPDVIDSKSPAISPQADFEPWRSILLGHNTFLYPSLTVWENLNFWVGLEEAIYQQSGTNAQGGTGQNRQAKIAETLNLLGLSALRDEKVATLSKGMAQRLTLGRLYLTRARLWLLDEPESALDQDALLKLMHLVLAQKHCVVIWASHSLPANYIANTQQLFTHCLCLNAKHSDETCETELRELSGLADSKANNGTSCEADSTINSEARTC